MRTILWLSLVMVVATATCDSLSGVNGESGEVTQDSTIPPEYSRVNQEVYRAHATPIRQTGNKNAYIAPPPIPKLPPPPTRSLSRTGSAGQGGLKAEEYNKPKAIKPPQTSATQKTSSGSKKHNEDDGRQRFGTRTYSVPMDNEDVDPCTQEYNDSELEPVDYPIPTVPSTFAPQSEQPAVIAQQAPVFVRRPAIIAPQPPIYRAVLRAIRRGLRQPAYRRIYNPASPIYRPLDYARPITYAISVPTARRIVYEPAAVRYVERPSISYDSIGGADYDNVLNADYEEVKK